MIDESHTADSDGRGPETVQSAMVWQRTGLDVGTQHTIVVSFNQAMDYVALDGIM